MSRYNKEYSNSSLAISEQPFQFDNHHLELHNGVMVSSGERNGSQASHENLLQVVQSLIPPSQMATITKANSQCMVNSCKSGIFDVIFFI